MDGGSSRPLGERLANNLPLVIIAAISAIIGIVVFVTGKNLPDLLTTSAAQHSSGRPSVSTPTLVSSTPGRAPNSTAEPISPPSQTPTAKPSGGRSSTNPVSPVVRDLAVPDLAEIKACFQQLEGPGFTLADEDLNDDNLGKPATLHIVVSSRDKTYRLIAADSTCHPTTLATVGPGQTATVREYFGAMWDFVRGTDSWGPTGEGPLGPLRLGPFDYEIQPTKITITTG